MGCESSSELLPEEKGEREWGWTKREVREGGGAEEGLLREREEDTKNISNYFDILNLIIRYIMSSS